MEAVKRFVYTYPGMTPKQIADELYMKYNVVTRALSRLCEKGQVVNQFGHYFPNSSMRPYYDFSDYVFPGEAQATKILL